MLTLNYYLNNLIIMLMNSIIYLLKEEMQLQDQVITFFILIIMDHIKVSNY